jgi:hypothetical protein
MRPGFRPSKPAKKLRIFRSKVKISLSENLELFTEKYVIIKIFPDAIVPLIEHSGNAWTQLYYCPTFFRKREKPAPRSA